jgi:hypothetical protein
MCNDEALNVVISTINANIHVFVHVDLHEIYLLNVNRKVAKENSSHQPVEMLTGMCLEWVAKELQMPLKN